MNSELLARAQGLYAQSQNAEEQLMQIEEQISQLGAFQEHLAVFSTSTHTDILANFGKGVYFPAQIKSKQVIVDAGAGVFVEKSLADAQLLVSEQIKKLYEFKKTMQSMLDSFSVELDKLVNEVEKTKEI